MANNKTSKHNASKIIVPKTTTVKDNLKDQKFSLRKTLILSIIAGILLLIANSAIWVNQQIFNETNFSNTATNSLTSESSRNALASSLTDRIFADRPIAKRLAGNTSEKIISGLLGTDQTKTALDFVTGRLHVILTSDQKEEIAIDLSGIKSTVGEIITVIETTGKDPKLDPVNIPDKVVIIEEGAIPSLYKIVLFFMWFAPIAFIASITILSIQYIQHKKQYKLLMIIQGSVIFAVGLLGLLLGPLFKPAVLAQINKSDGRVVVGNLYDAFIATFNSQTAYLISFGVAMTLVGVTLYYIPKVRSFVNSQGK